MSDYVIQIPSQAVYYWYLDVGSFFDRFGVAMIPALMSVDPVTVALVKNIQSREWVDLKNPQVAAALAYMSGTNVPGLGTIGTAITGLTTGLVNTILNTVPTATEQFATVSKFFS